MKSASMRSSGSGFEMITSQIFVAWRWVRESNPLMTVLRTVAFPLGYVARSVVFARVEIAAALVRDDVDLPCEHSET